MAPHSPNRDYATRAAIGLPNTDYASRAAFGRRLAAEPFLSSLPIFRILRDGASRFGVSHGATLVAEDPPAGRARGVGRAEN